MTRSREWEYCAYCGGGLDTGWECNTCQADWRSHAYPWRERLWDKTVAALKRAKGKKP